MNKPVLIVIAGPNGSGKTIVTTKILKHQWLKNAVYINPDIIAKEQKGFLLKLKIARWSVYSENYHEAM